MMATLVLFADTGRADVAFQAWDGLITFCADVATLDASFSSRYINISVNVACAAFDDVLGLPYLDRNENIHYTLHQILCQQNQRN